MPNASARLCPICGRPAVHYRRRFEDRASSDFACDECGVYRIGDLSSRMVPKHSEARRSGIARHVRELNRQGFIALVSGAKVASFFKDDAWLAGASNER
jgi:hypothetical protein